jgi:hypothetical protein
MTDKPVTRRQLRTALMANAATDPTALVVAAVIVVAAILTNLLWLIPVFALPGYLALAGMTFFSEESAAKVADRVYGRSRGELARSTLDEASLAPPIARHLEEARRVLASLLRAIEQAQTPFTDVGKEARGIVTAMERTAMRAQVLYDYLAIQDRDGLRRRIAGLERATGDAELLGALREQAAAIDRVDRRLERFYVEMERMTSTLATMSARLIEMSAVEETAAQRELAGQARELREQVDALAAGMAEAYGEATPRSG